MASWPSDLTRHLILAVVLTPLLSLAADSFWNLIPPARWTPQQTAQFLTASPWAKTVRATMSENADKAAPISDPPSRGGLRPLRPRGNATGSSSTALAFYGDVTVIWASAAPVLAVRKLPGLPQFGQHHVISVAGLPPQIVRNANGLDLFLSTSLTPGRRSPVPPDFVHQSDDGRTLYLAFPVQKLRLRSGDRRVVFSLTVGGVVVKTVFELPLMFFSGELAV